MWAILLLSWSKLMVQLANKCNLKHSYLHPDSTEEDWWKQILTININKCQFLWKCTLLVVKANCKICWAKPVYSCWMSKLILDIWGSVLKAQKHTEIFCIQIMAKYLGTIRQLIKKYCLYNILFSNVPQTPWEYVTGAL